MFGREVTGSWRSSKTHFVKCSSSVGAGGGAGGAGGGGGGAGGAGAGLARFGGIRSAGGFVPPFFRRYPFGVFGGMQNFGRLPSGSGGLPSPEQELREEQEQEGGGLLQEESSSSENPPLKTHPPLKIL